MGNFDYLSVYNCENKIRVGSTYDGGYIIIDNLCDYDVLLSCGIANDDTFEHYFVNKYKTLCYAFDGTINRLPRQHNKIIFNKQNIGVSKNTNDLTKLIDKHNNIFIKMDIEGSEYAWLDNLNNEQLNKLKQICIEFHLEHECSNHIDLQYKLNAIKKLTKTHYCVHFHGNNWRSTTVIGEKVIDIFPSKTSEVVIDLDKEYPNGTVTFDYKSQFPIRFDYELSDLKLIIRRVDKDSGWDFKYRCVINGIQIPKVFEVTYIHKSLLHNHKLNDIPIPNIIYDTPNTGNWRPPTDDFENNRLANKKIPDIVITEPPFVNKIK